MPVPLDFLKDPWANTGDRATFPYNPDTLTELMSWIKGFTAKYQRIPEEGGVYIERREFNQILYLLTKQIIDAFKITASDKQLNDEIAAITDEIADITKKDEDLQNQLNAKFMKVKYLNMSFGVTYTADNSGIICVDLQWGLPGVFQSPGCKYMNAELRCSNGQPQYVFPCYGAWNSSGEVVAGARPNMSLVTILEKGTTFQLLGETSQGFNGASGIIVKSAKILY